MPLAIIHNKIFNIKIYITQIIVPTKFTFHKNTISVILHYVTYQIGMRKWLQIVYLDVPIGIITCDCGKYNIAESGTTISTNCSTVYGNKRHLHNSSKFTRPKFLICVPRLSKSEQLVQNGGQSFEIRNTTEHNTTRY